MRDRLIGSVVPMCRQNAVAMKTVIPSKFGVHRKRILELSLADPAFRDRWRDYCKVLATLQPLEGETDELRRLRDELEDEIKTALD